MGSLVNSSGEWKNSLPYVKADGEWKIPKSAWTKKSDGWKSWFLQSGLSDSGFNQSDTNGGLNEQSNAVVAQPDGKTLVGGNFDLYGQAKTGGIIRFNSNGTIDTDFHLNLGSGLARKISTTAPTNYQSRPIVSSIALQSDGKILVVGRFELFNEIPVTNIVRLNPDGTLDGSFTANSKGFNDQGFFNSINAIAVQTDGKILVGGDFTFFNDIPINGFARLNADGSLDTVFNQNTGTGMTNLEGEFQENGRVFDIKIQPDNKILVVGYFKKFNGTVVNSLVRLNSNGTIDSNFTNNNGTGIPDSEQIENLTIQSDSKIIFSGPFSSFNGADVPNIVRLNLNGTIDTNFAINRDDFTSLIFSLRFNPTTQKILIGSGAAPFLRQINLDGNRDNGFTPSPLAVAVRSIDIQLDNKIVMAGGFFSNVGRLNSNGILDNSFLANSSTGFNERVEVITVQSDDKILVGGGFVAFDNTPLNFIARLNSDGTPDENFKNNNGLGPNGPVLAIETQSDGKIIIGGLFTRFNGVVLNRIARLNSDGTPDNDFNINAGTAFDNAVGAIAIQSDGKILVGGSFSNFDGQNSRRMARLNSDGTLDTSFSVGTGFNTVSGRPLRSLKIQENGKIVVAGSFSSFNAISVNYIARLNSDGSLDTSFKDNTGSGFNFYGESLAIQSDGKILVGGLFSSFNGVTVSGIVRLNSNGTLDTEFTNNVGSGTQKLGNTSSGGVYSLVVQLDEKIIGGGSFEKFNDIPVGSIFCLNSDGTLNDSFVSNIGAGFDFKTFETFPVNGYAVRSLAIQKDNKIVIGGKFNIFNNINRSNIARIGGDPTTA
jgi:uncharacterized delta-60 repeat protein